jgi:hypothetical protein
MNDRSEWQAAAEDLIARERERLGDPPTAGQVAAYARGELSEAEAARVRALLIVHPEAAALLTQDVDADVEGVLSDVEMQHDWNAIRQRIAADAPPRPSFVSRALPIAALIAIGVLGVMWFQARSALKEERLRPRVLSTRHELFPIDTSRGAAVPEPYPLQRQEDPYLLSLLLHEDARGEYRIEIVDEQKDPPRTIWRSRVAPRNERSIELSIPCAFFTPGTTYRLNLYRDAEAAPALTYLLRVR